MSKCISVLGSTGSIGRQTLQVAEELGLRVAALTAGRQIDLLEQQARQFRPCLAAVYEEAAARELRERLKDPGLDQLFSDLLDATETEYDPEGKERVRRKLDSILAACPAPNSPPRSGNLRRWRWSLRIIEYAAAVAAVVLALHYRHQANTPREWVEVYAGMGERREIVQFCRQAHQWTCEQVKAGVMAGDIAKKFYQYFVDNGFKDNFVYGPLHSTGIIDDEAPWAETTSMYPLQPNMTYQADTFISCPTFGVRWEKGIVVTESGCDILSPEIPEVCPELMF